MCVLRCPGSMWQTDENNVYSLAEGIWEKCQNRATSFLMNVTKRDKRIGKKYTYPRTYYQNTLYFKQETKIRLCLKCPHWIHVEKFNPASWLLWLETVYIDILGLFDFTGIQKDP